MKDYLRNIFTIILLGLISQNLSAQIGIGDSNFTPESSAILEIKSNSKGVLIPRYSTSDRNNISSPAPGLLVFDYETKSFWYYSGGWKELGKNRKAHEISNEIGHTKITVEDTPDEDNIKFSVLNSNRLKILMKTNTVAELIDADHNSFFGFNTGLFNSGSSNSFLGPSISNQGVSHNSIIGYKGGGSGTGNNNVIAGSEAGLGLGTGSNNVLLGSKAGYSLGTGSNNTIIGHEAGLNATDVSNNILIGNQVGQDITTSDNLMLDNINTTTPLLYGKLSGDPFLQINGACIIPGLGIRTIWISNDGDEEGLYAINSKFGINTTSPGKRLTVNGDMYASGSMQVKQSHHAPAYDRKILSATLTVEANGTYDNTSTTNSNSNLIGSVVKNSTGNYTINFATGYSIDEPIGVVSAYNDNYGHIAGSTSTSIVVNIFNDNGTAVDSKFTIFLVAER